MGVCGGVEGGGRGNSTYYTCTQRGFSNDCKGYCSGGSHLSEINAKLAEKNEFVTHFQKCLETDKNE